MFKFRSYNVKKASEKTEKEQPKSSISTGTLKKPASSSSGTKSLSSASSSSYVSPKTKTKPSPQEIKAINNKQSPEYSKKIYPKKTVTEWRKNATYSAKNETKKLVIPSLHKKLERK